MCYAIKPASLPGIRIAGALPAPNPDGFHYARDTVPVFLAGGEMRPMRWDLVPRGFMSQENGTLAEALRRKNSRAINPATGRSWGFSSYNARLETVETLWAFKEAWRDRKRGVIPVEAFRERPNMEEAPAEFRGREYEISLDARYYLAALFDTWTSKRGEVLESCTVITGPSDAIPELQSIWHERVPILLRTEAARVWLDPATPPAAAFELLRAAAVPPLTVCEVSTKARANGRSAGLVRRVRERRSVKTHVGPHPSTRARLKPGIPEAPGP
jgi:putative SOS response-associated peptidase YedK